MSKLFRGEPTEEYKFFLKCRRDCCDNKYVYGGLATFEDKTYIIVEMNDINNRLAANAEVTLVEVNPSSVEESL